MYKGLICWALVSSACSAADPLLRQGMADAEHRPAQARASLQPYAMAGHAQAIASICVAYGRSIDSDVRGPERTQAFAWCLQAAKAGAVKAQYHLGMFYKSGIGTAQDRDAALRWFQQAASLGHKEANNEARGLQGLPRICENFITGCKMF